MELVTGFAGTAHIDPIDAAHLNAAGFGPDAYLLDTQNKLEASLETANKLVVDTGDLMIQGHHFTVIEPENIALQSGVSGQKRNALVCARYDKTEGTGVESASWIVKYGTATTGTPADPSVTTGNILDGVDSVHEEPIFRIEYDGITPGNPILLVPEFQSASEFRTSIDQVPIKTAEIEAGCTLYYYGDNTVEISVYDMLMRGVNTWNLGTLDKPPHHKVCMALCAADGDHTGVLWVNEQGGVVCKHNNNGAYHYSGNVRFPLIKTT